MNLLVFHMEVSGSPWKAEEEPFDRCYEIRGAIHLKRGEADKAVEQFSLAIPLNPDNPSLYRNRAIAQITLGRTSLAIEDLKKALQVASPVWAHRGLAEQELRTIQSVFR